MGIPLSELRTQNVIGEDFFWCDGKLIMGFPNPTYPRSGFGNPDLVVIGGDSEIATYHYQRKSPPIVHIDAAGT
jgi:hypothetical protein